MTRHILGLSGGKDSTALAILMHKEVPQMEYFFCDTGKELPETYEYLERIKARLGIKIEYLNAERDFDHWLEVFNGVLPSPRVRWCTRKLKIEPLEKFVGDDKAVSYIGIRADENREGYVSAQPNIYPVYPFKERGLVKSDILNILDDSGIGLPSYYEWRSRSGCSFCFFQRKYEWVKLAEKHPEEFAQAVAYERDHKDGRTYTWTQGETLLELIARKDQVIADHEKAIAREKKTSPKLSLAEVLESVLDDEDDEMPCLACHL
ncbi:MAG: phosphoadenosine phosphosulfate reductase family protein [Pseudanabaena sp. M090S1SP1A06QC]|jgi:PP-loop superfamily ATP-utilizing enzyme|uniref:phosphoadenosine phosphosulfate reductase family protein n=1 Tax=Pseudanabaena mucicola TaxID=71190 RepID=UPI0025788433|nr:phosphoadenosine phosphosulfate reductase family protein [Pseudanabaena mucicola]MCA6573097.1 phosphoadenosine phosphosulfate reductase family protein [Pseudanabaena sp. M53BS1SP1A06MG]MCA6581106.1 phosphoadenosine phosphosulfate reductase family protein [Pseudanabaena sp. M34BS1SP1A06MG]MCA6592344.1 phosphoadenosine phosphosulfate reductase family protein [Pseudanabaena sp. M38BS1SP1A06MG]MCA6595594.1 phosphoadenosine phosphosulfate reductase family protein [Pseudanabaena sp. M046S1SP1A06QC